MLTKKIACPSCSVKLRIAKTVPEGKRVKCPKCGNGFPVPGGSGEPLPEVATGKRKRKSHPAGNGEQVPEVATGKRKKKSHPAEELEWGEAVEKRPIYQTRRKLRTKQSSRTAIRSGLAIIFVAFVIGAGVTLVWFLRASAARHSAAAGNAPSTPISETAAR
jgi:hypothetical protein